MRHFRPITIWGRQSDSLQVLVALGDSTVVDTGASKVEDTVVSKTAAAIASARAYVHVVNLAKSGANIAEVASGQLPCAVALKPTMILVSVGANDATHFTDLKKYQKSLQTIVTGFARTGASQILVASSPDWRLTPAFPRWFSNIVGRRSDRQNDLLQQITPGTSIQRIDLYREGKLDYATDHALYAADLFHPSSHGYAK